MDEEILLKDKRTPETYEGFYINNLGKVYFYDDKNNIIFLDKNILNKYEIIKGDKNENK
jgi:archaellum component FlaG (FlaF/FlaG flagellin family)